MADHLDTPARVYLKANTPMKMKISTVIATEITTRYPYSASTWGAVVVEAEHGREIRI